MPTLSFTDERDFLLKTGLHFIVELQRDAQTAPEQSQLSKDWSVIATWLGNSGDDLTETQANAFQRGWESYLAIGLAPSHKLQPAFEHFATQVSADTSQKPPTDVMNVFDRLMASEEEIRLKRASDWEAERKRFAPIFDRQHRRQIGWWRSQDKLVRTGVFVCIIWAIAVIAYGLVFDPFDVGGWADMSDDETLRLVVVAMLPVIAAGVYQIYRKLVR